MRMAYDEKLPSKFRKLICCIANYFQTLGEILFTQTFYIAQRIVYIIIQWNHDAPFAIRRESLLVYFARTVWCSFICSVHNVMLIANIQDASTLRKTKTFSIRISNSLLCTHCTIYMSAHSEFSSNSFNYFENENGEADNVSTDPKFTARAAHAFDMLIRTKCKA